MKSNGQLTTDFRIFLKMELARKCKKNPFYSLRAFAKQLGVSHTSLSQILSGKRPLTQKAQKKMINSLGLSTKEVIRFKLPQEMTFEERFEPIEIEKFEMISEWYYDAILELTRLKAFKPDPKWIARVLEVNIHHIHLAIERLSRLGFLKIEETGRWIDLTVNNSTNFDDSIQATGLRKYQKDILQKSLDAVDLLPRDQRDHTSLMLNFSSQDLKKAKKLIKKFRTEFSTAAQGVNADNVYALNISFFPISKIKE